LWISFIKSNIFLSRIFEVSLLEARATVTVSSRAVILTRRSIAGDFLAVGMLLKIVHSRRFWMASVIFGSAE
jgi:hypothetical protein